MDMAKIMCEWMCTSYMYIVVLFYYGFRNLVLVIVLLHQPFVNLVLVMFFFMLGCFLVLVI